MSNQITITSTVHPLHFEDLSGHQFERLVFSFLHSTKKWDKLEWLGQVGSDGGRDIWGEYDKKTFCYQCANYRSLDLKKIKIDIDKLVTHGTIPDYYTVMTGGLVSPHARQAIYKYALEKGIKETKIYSATELEMLLRDEAPEIIKRFFNGQPFSSSNKTQCEIIGVPFKTSMIFEGRDEVLASLADLLTNGSNVALSASIEGLGGIGKTELVLHLIHSEKITDFFKCIVWIDGAAAIEDQWYSIAEILQLKFTSSDIRANLERIESTLLQKGNCLVIVDNAHKWHEISDYLPIRVPLLVTTRTHDFGGNTFIHKQIQLLSNEAAMRILTAISASIGADKNLARLLERLEGHALAIELAGLCIKAMRLSVAEYLERINRYESEPTFVVEQTKHLQTINTCLLATWNQLSKPARQLWIYASMFAPTTARQGLLKDLFMGQTETYNELVIILENEITNSRHLTTALGKHRKMNFEELFAELSLYGVLSRVNEEHGETSWNMHRIVRDFTYGYTTRFHRVCFAFNFSEWLKIQVVIHQSDIPHIVNSTLESLKHLVSIKSIQGERNFASEISNLGFPGRMHSILFDPMGLFRFIEHNLNAPAIMPILRDGLKNPNPNVVFQSLLFLEHAPQFPDFISPLFSCLASAHGDISVYAEKYLVIIAQSNLFDELMNQEIRMLLESKDQFKQWQAVNIIKKSGISKYWNKDLYLVLNEMFIPANKKFSFLVALSLVRPEITITEQLIEIIDAPVVNTSDAKIILNSLDFEYLSNHVASFLLKIFENRLIHTDDILSIFIASNGQGLEKSCWFLINNCLKCNSELVNQLIRKMIISETIEYRKSVLEYFLNDDSIVYRKNALINRIRKQAHPHGLDILLDILRCSFHYFQPTLDALYDFNSETNNKKIGLAILETYIKSKQTHIFLLPLLHALVKFEYKETIPSLRVKLNSSLSFQMNDIIRVITELENF